MRSPMDHYISYTAKPKFYFLTVAITRVLHPISFLQTARKIASFSAFVFKCLTSRRIFVEAKQW